MMNKLLFVCGFPSGGTDLLKTILNAHPDIYINGEMPFLKEIIKHGYSRHTMFSDDLEIYKFQQILESIDIWGNIENITHNFKDDLIKNSCLDLEYVLQNCFSDNETKIWGNKTPQNTEEIPLLVELFPNAKFIIIVRDVRDVCLSWRNKWGKSIFWCSQKWAIRMKKGWKETLTLPPHQFLWIKYEDLLSDQEIIVKKICAFLDLPFSGRMLEHHKYIDKMLDGKINYGKPIIKANYSKWKRYLTNRQVNRIEEIGFETMQIFDYPITSARNHKQLTKLELFYGVVNDTLANLLVGNRAKKDNSFKFRLSKIIYEINKRRKH
jgi:hypothetical protein